MQFFTPLIEKLNNSVSKALSNSKLSLEESYIAPSGTVNPNHNSNTLASSFSSEFVGNLSPGFNISSSHSETEVVTEPPVTGIEPLNSTFSEKHQFTSSLTQSTSKANDKYDPFNHIDSNDQEKSLSTSPILSSQNPVSNHTIHLDKNSQEKLSNENDYLCDTCQNEGCCQICHKIPCDGTIKCSAKTCQKWTHYNCGNTTEKESESLRIYYCPPCKESNPMLKNIYYKSKKSKSKQPLLVNTQKSKKKKLELPKKAKNKTEKTSQKNALKFADKNRQKNENLPEKNVSTPHEKISKNFNPENPPNAVLIENFGLNNSNSKTEQSNLNKTHEMTMHESFSQPLDDSEAVKKQNITITGTEMVEIFSKQLEGLHANIFHLKHRIKELETERSKNKFISYEKNKLDELETENKKLKLENFELSETVNKLENKLFHTTENLTQLQAKCKENDYGLEKLDHLNNLQLKNKIKKTRPNFKSPRRKFP